MKKYLIKLIFQVKFENEERHAQFDEQVRLIEAHGIEDAYLKAQAIGKKEEEVIGNKARGSVSWCFIGIPEIYELERSADGDQIFGNTIFENDPHSYIGYIRQRAMEFQVKNLSFA